MIHNFKEIFDAWITSIKPSQEEKELAQKRLEICKGCEHKKETVKGQKWSIICEACGCPLSKKVFSKLFNPCPRQKWGQIDGDYGLNLSKKENKTII